MIKLFIDLDGTIAKFNVRNALERFDKEKGFFAKLGAYVGIETINNLALTKDIYIISASPNEQADKDKMLWLERYLPNIPKANITLCRLGQNKAQIIENKYSMKINNNCLLLDDYTKNLIEWERVGGIGVKRLTSISDNSRGLWTGLTVKHLSSVVNLFEM